MNEETWERLALYFGDYGDRYHGDPATADEVDAASVAVGVPFTNDYREFVLRYGSAMVGGWSILGLKAAPKLRSSWSVVLSTEKYRSDGWPGTESWAVISCDPGGNPLGLAMDGRVWIADHDSPGPLREGGRWMFEQAQFGVIEPLYSSFEEFLLMCLYDTGY